MEEKLELVIGNNPEEDAKAIGIVSDLMASDFKQCIDGLKIVNAAEMPKLHVADVINPYPYLTIKNNDKCMMAQYNGVENIQKGLSDFVRDYANKVMNGDC